MGIKTIKRTVKVRKQIKRKFLFMNLNQNEIQEEEREFYIPCVIKYGENRYLDKDLFAWSSNRMDRVLEFCICDTKKEAQKRIDDYLNLTKVSK